MKKVFILSICLIIVIAISAQTQQGFVKTIGRPGKPGVPSENSNMSRNVVSEVSVAVEYGKKIIPIRLDMSSYSESIEYDIINHDYVVYDKSRVEESNRDMLKKIVSTLEMV